MNVGEHQFTLVLLALGGLAHAADRLLAYYLEKRLLRDKAKKSHHRRHQHTVAGAGSDVHPVEISDHAGEDVVPE